MSQHSTQEELEDFVILNLFELRIVLSVTVLAFGGSAPPFHASTNSYETDNNRVGFEFGLGSKVSWQTVKAQTYTAREGTLILPNFVTYLCLFVKLYAFRLLRSKRTHRRTHTVANMSCTLTQNNTTKCQELVFISLDIIVLYRRGDCEWIE